jgi:hypothetical protein
MKYIFLLAMGVTLFFGCRYFGGKRIRGNGNLVTQERTVSGYEGLDNYGSFNITLVPSSTTSVKIEAEENLQQYIITQVSDNRLQIRTKNNYNLRPRKDIRITVSGPVFTSITTNGSGNITGQGPLNTNNGNVSLRVAGSGNIDVELSAAKVESQIAGSGNIKVKGTSKEFEGGIAGSGNIWARDLMSEDSKVQIAGSGNIEVYATRNLDVNVMGSGEVKHRGTAQVSASITGSGSVNKID